MDRFDRQRALFGDEGQQKISEARVAIVGLGGLGSFVAMELAYLGVGGLVLIDHDHLEVTNRNRLIGAWESHAEETAKVAIAGELVQRINRAVEVCQVPIRFGEDAADARLDGCSHVLGCVDDDFVRLRLNELCCQRGIPLIDAASDTLRDGEELGYGGRVACALPETGCLVCLDVLDQRGIREQGATAEQRRDHDAIYGIRRDLVETTGPSVVTVNGVVASLSATEFMVLATGLRAPFCRVDYLGNRGVVLRSKDRGEPGCYYCAMRPARS